MRNLASDNPEEIYKKDYHGHPKYFTIWLVLLGLMLITILPVLFGMDTTTAIITGVFVVSAIKAFMVISNFMHIKFEPKPLIGIVGFSVFVLAAFFFGVLPDVPTADGGLRHPNTMPSTTTLISNDDKEEVAEVKNNIKEFVKDYHAYGEKVMKAAKEDK